MGIRYYAYAFDSDQTGKALADPKSMIGSDPLSDAWGVEPGSMMGIVGSVPALPERDFLYLDKAWRFLQRATAPRRSDATPRVAYQMFEGQVDFDDDGCSWRPWVRALPPDAVAAVARDLEHISDGDIIASLSPGTSLDADAAYAAEYLHRASRFAAAVAADGRGFAYIIG